MLLTSNIYIKTLITLSLLYSTSACAHGNSKEEQRKALKKHNRFGQIMTPSKKEPASIGRASNGCLDGATDLSKKQNERYKISNKKRNFYYAHPQLAQLVSELAKRNKSCQIVLRDLAQPQGGIAWRRHRSHQNGLDADIEYSCFNDGKTGREPSLENRRDQEAVINVPIDPPIKHNLAKNGSIITKEQQFYRLVIESENDLNKAEVEYRKLTGKSLKNYLKSEDIHIRYWNSAIQKTLKQAAKDPRVERVLVNPTLKYYLCDKYVGHYKSDLFQKKCNQPEVAWLKKIRVVGGHTGHFHLRMACPQSNQKASESSANSCIESPVTDYPTETGGCGGLGCGGIYREDYELAPLQTEQSLEDSNFEDGRGQTVEEEVIRELNKKVSSMPPRCQEIWRQSNSKPKQVGSTTPKNSNL